MGKPGRPQGSTNYTTEQFINAIPGTGGIISAIAKRIGCKWHTARNFIDTHPTVKQAYEAECEGVLDLAEVKLIETVKAGDFPAIKFYLTTKGKNRGYTERQEITGADGGEIIFKTYGNKEAGDI